MCISGCNSSKQSKLSSLKAEKSLLEGITAKGSGKSFGEVAAAFARLKDVSHQLSILETGTGLYKGSRSGDTTASAKTTDCTDYVLEVLEDAFAQQGQSTAWTSVEAKMRAITKLRGKEAELSGIDLQAALQAKQRWGGVFWAPDPMYKGYTWVKLKSEEQLVAYMDAKKKQTYYKKPPYPGVRVEKLVVNYAPEQGSSTVQDTTELNRLKKLPFGVFSAHGGRHMCLILSGYVYEVHWTEKSDSEKLMEGTLLEEWGGLGRWGSGAIVAPQADLNKAWKT